MVGLKHFAKLFDGKPGVADDTAEGKCVDGVVTRDGAGLFESADGIEMIDAWNLWLS